MGQIGTIGLDIARHVLQAHGADGSGTVLFRKRLRRAQLLAFFAAQPPCVVAMEACGGAHHWGGDRPAGAHRAADPTGLCEALREAAEERCGRRRGDPRGGAAPDDALRGGQRRASAGRGAGVPHPRPARPTTHAGDQRPARALCRVRHCRGEGTAACGPARRPGGGADLRSTSGRPDRPCRAGRGAAQAGWAHRGARPRDHAAGEGG